MSRKKGDPVYNAIYGPFKNNPAGNALALNERMYIRILTELSANRFKWVGMPSTIDERFLELTLFHQSLSIFYFDDRYNRYMAVRGMGSGRINPYDNPTRFTVTGSGGFISRELMAKDCVPIWGNFLRMPDIDIVYVYAKKLAKIDRTIEINLDNMRYSKVVTTTENQRQTYVNLLRQHQEGQPVIFGTEGLNMENVQVFDLGIDKDIVLNLQLSKQKLWNECMTLLGINNANQDKKERLVSSEVDANDEQVVSARGIALNSRRIAAQQINARFNLAVDVGWNPEAAAMAGEYASMGAL